MANDDVLIIGKLEDKDLLDSIDKLVSDVADKSQLMANKFEGAMNKMTEAMKNFAISQKVSVDLMKESWKDMSASFDAMFKAQSDATGGGKGSGKPTYADNTVGALEQNIANLKKERKEMELNSDVLREQNKLIDERTRKLKEQTTSLATIRLDKTLRMPSNDLDEAQKKLRVLEILQNRYKDSTELSEKQQKRLIDAIARTKKEIDKLNSAKPKTLKEVLGMDESSVDAVAKKMRALRTVTINPQNRHEVAALGNEYQRLSRLLADLLGKGIQLTHSNNYLAQSFGYIRNRIVYAMTLGAVTNFIKQMYEVRGQYELLERSLGILIDDMRLGTQVFNELNQMALKSPFTLVELATGAKQLLAYNFAEEEVVDTTRRLADISAALGVPMERLVYNLGQIKAQTALTARDARDFANAGLAIVPMLAQMYTEEKRFGDEIVTTAQVFDMMSKKMVSYNDVMKVINKVTDEGGKFFDFQAKQADTLRVKMANLTLAWNNMLNEIGQENQGVLTLPLRGLKMLFENWKTLASVIKEVVIAYGAYKAAAITTAALNSQMFIGRILVNWRNYTAAIKSATGAMATFNAVTKMSPVGAIAGVLAAIVGYMALFNDSMDDAGNYTEKFGAAGAKVINQTEALFDTLKGMSNESSNYKKVMGELNSILEEYGIETVKETDTLEMLNAKRKMAIALIKEETLERKHLNDVQQGRDKFETTANEVKSKFKESLKNAMTGNDLWMSADENLRKNSEAIANIIGDVIESNIMLIAGKTGDEYQQGVEQIYAKIQEKMRAIGIDEATINSQWVENRWYGQVNIVDEYINKIKEAKEAQNDYTEAIDAAYESEKKATESGASFNDRVDQTTTQLMKAANDTENFYKKIDKLIKDYSGENIIGFLVKVKTEVPAWMAQKSLTELTQLSARFSALATQAKKAGKSSLNVGGNEYTVDQLFQRAAQYAQAAQNKKADIEARKSSTITREASEALKEYKSAIEAVNVAKNRQKQGTADATLVQEKEAEAQKKYNKALEKGVSLEELQKAKNGKGKGGAKKDPLGDALQKEVQLINDMQKLYKEYQKAGIDTDTARIASAKEYEKTLKSTNAELAKFGIKGLSGEELAVMDARALRDYYIRLRDLANLKGNTKGVEALEKAISSLNTEITKIDYKKITEGLNSELAKLKDDYELAIELDANPELGNMFASAIGMSEEDVKRLPHTIEQVLGRAQASVDKWLKEANISTPFDVMTGDIEELRKESGSSIDSQLIERLEKVQKDVRGLWKKDMEEKVKGWDTLLEKYAEYETKAAKIQKDAAQERVTFINQFGDADQKEQAIQLETQIRAATDDEARNKLINQLHQLALDIAGDDRAKVDIITSIGAGEKSNLAKNAFEEFQSSPIWITATGDLAGMTDGALRMLAKDIEKFKNSAKGLSAKNIKEINKALISINKEQKKNNPFKALSISALNAKERMATFDEQIKETEDKLDELYKKQNQSNLSETGSEIAELIEKLKNLKEAQKKEGKIDAVEIVGDINTIVQAAGQGVQMINSLVDSMRGDNWSEAQEVMNDTFHVIEKGGQGAMIGAQIGKGYGAIIGAVVGVGMGLFESLADNANKKIDSQIKDSEVAVKRLEVAYVDLQHAMDDAYGTGVVSSKRLAASMKELELAELEHQLALEQSRDSKHRDEGKIADIQKQVKELRYEIEDTITEITNDLLGGEAGSFAENLVDAMIDSFKKGEDYMKVFEEKFDDMVDNMIMKSITSKVVAQYIDNLWDEMDERIKGRSYKESEQLAAATKRREELEAMDVYAYAWEEHGIGKYGLEQVEEARDKMQKLLETELQAARMAEEAAQKNYDSVATMDDSDISFLISKLAEIKPELGERLREILGEYYKFGETSNKELSALQQGIQGITEDTAGALEAYMNGMSQQVYLQSDILSQIRDAVVGFNMDIQVASMSQILLQLRSSYEVQMSIHSLLNGWNNPSGNAMRVELV